MYLECHDLHFLIAIHYAFIISFNYFIVSKAYELLSENVIENTVNNKCE